MSTTIIVAKTTAIKITMTMDTYQYYHEDNYHRCQLLGTLTKQSYTPNYDHYQANSDIVHHTVVYEESILLLILIVGYMIIIGEQNR
jgi:hypothetical protein